MSSLWYTVLGRSRLALQRTVIVRAPCLWKRLEPRGKLFSFAVRATSTASAGTLRVADQTHVESQIESNDTVRGGSRVPRPSGIKFEQHEMRYYHSVMEALPQYRSTLFTRSDLDSLKCEASCDVAPLLEREDWSKATCKEITDAFFAMTMYAVQNELTISDSKFSHICHAIKGRISEFSDEELVNIGKLHSIWPSCESVNCKNYKSLYESFDSECCSRYQKIWYASRNMTTILQAADIFYWKRLGSKSHYLRCMVYHLAIKTKEPHHLMQIMFYLGIMKSAPDSYKFYDLEKKVFSFVEQYSLQELAIFVNSLFRLKSMMQYYPLMQDLLVKSLKNFSIIDDFMVITVSKGFHRAPSELRPLLALFQRRLLSRVDVFQFESIIHALWLFGLNNVLDDEFGQVVFERGMKHISVLRTKELTRMLTIFTENVSPNRDLKKLGESVVQEFKDPLKKEWWRRKSFIQGATLHRLLICGVCPKEFLDEYLSSMTTPEIANEALGVDVHLEVFYPSYTGARLSSHIREAVFKNRFQNSTGKFVKSNGSEGKRSTFNLGCVESAKHVLRDILDGKDDHFAVRQLVPSSGYLDVVLRVSKDGRYLPIPKQIVELDPWEVTKIPTECLENGDKFIAITFLRSPSELSDKNMMWLQRDKIAILKKLGYIPVEVSAEDRRQEHGHKKGHVVYVKADLLKILANELSD